MIGKTSGALAALATLILAFVLTPAPAHAILERMGPISTAHGYPEWVQDKTGLALDFCSPTTQYELTAGFCLILPGPPPAISNAPEVFPTNFSDEHFYYAVGAKVDMNPGGGTRAPANLVQAVEGAFSTGAVVPGAQIVFTRLRFQFVNLPIAGDYKIFTPYGIYTFPGLKAGAKLFFTEDVGIACPPGDFTCALAGSIGPFLMPSLPTPPATLGVPGGPEKPPFADPLLPGKLYLADPAYLGPVTGSVMGTYATSSGPRDSNIFRCEVTTPGGVVVLFEEFNFSVQGRLFQGAIPSRVVVDRASYSRSLANNVTVDGYATGEPAVMPRRPGVAQGAAVIPNLALYDRPCGGTLGADGVTILPPFTAPPVTVPPGAPPVAMSRFGNVYYGHLAPAAIPAGACVVDLNARDAANSVVPQYTPVPVTDLVSITAADFDPVATNLLVQAQSSDLFLPPQLVLGAFGTMPANVPLVSGQIVRPSPVVPPESVRVLSQEFGSDQLQVRVVVP